MCWSGLSYREKVGQLGFDIEGTLGDREGRWTVGSASDYWVQYVHRVVQRNSADERIVPRKELEFHFPSGYEDEGTEGDKLWNQLMPREYVESYLGHVLMEQCSRFRIPACPTSEEICYAAE